MSEPDYIITNHARERFVERTFKDFKHLAMHDDRHCEQCALQRQQVLHEVAQYRHDINRQMVVALRGSKETRAYTNNSEFMGRLYERYGYDCRMEIREFGDATFVVSFNGSKKVVVTVLNSKYHSFGFRGGPTFWWRDKR